MSTDWRISSFNGALLAAYFIPTWTIVAFKIMISPIHGLYERPNIAVALFISDHLQLAAMTTVRFAWLLALGKLTSARVLLKQWMPSGKNIQFRRDQSRFRGFNRRGQGRFPETRMVEIVHAVKKMTRDC